MKCSKCNFIPKDELGFYDKLQSLYNHMKAKHSKEGSEAILDENEKIEAKKFENKFKPYVSFFEDAAKTLEERPEKFDIYVDSFIKQCGRNKELLGKKIKSLEDLSEKFPIFKTLIEKIKEKI